jgi:hypothetical protein
MAEMPTNICFFSITITSIEYVMQMIGENCDPDTVEIVREPLSVFWETLAMLYENAKKFVLACTEIDVYELITFCMRYVDFSMFFYLPNEGVKPDLESIFKCIRYIVRNGCARIDAVCTKPNCESIIVNFQYIIRAWSLRIEDGYAKHINKPTNTPAALVQKTELLAKMGEFVAGLNEALKTFADSIGEELRPLPALGGGGEPLRTVVNKK